MVILHFFGVLIINDLFKKFNIFRKSRKKGHFFSVFVFYGL